MALLSQIARRLGFANEKREVIVPTEEGIREWMAARLATHLKIERPAVDTQMRFDAYGLDSRVAIQVSGELEKLVERRLSPALLFEHPTIDAVSRAIALELAQGAEDA